MTRSVPHLFFSLGSGGQASLSPSVLCLCGTRMADININDKQQKQQQQEALDQQQQQLIFFADGQVIIRPITFSSLGRARRWLGFFN